MGLSCLAYLVSPATPEGPQMQEWFDTTHTWEAVVT